MCETSIDLLHIAMVKIYLVMIFSIHNIGLTEVQFDYSNDTPRPNAIGE